MTALATITDHRTDWLARGRTLATQRRDVDWALGDWLTDGRAAGYLDQTGFDFIADELGLSPKRLKLIEKAANIPASHRDTTLSIEHHAHVADLAAPEQLDMLKQAKAGHWSDDDLRKKVITLKASTGRIDAMSAEEWADHSMVAMQHAWNRAPREMRLEFYEMAGEANGGVIDV